MIYWLAYLFGAAVTYVTVVQLSAAPIFGPAALPYIKAVAGFAGGLVGYIFNNVHSAKNSDVMVGQFTLFSLEIKPVIII